MAYRAFEPSNIDAIAYRQSAAETREDRFSPAEVQVITLAARSDVTREQPQGSRSGRLFRWTFGRTTDRSLADPRLESLRRFASLLRHHPDRLNQADIDGFLAAGFSPGHLKRLAAYASNGKGMLPV